MAINEDDVYEKIYKIAVKKEITLARIIEIIPLVMEIVEEYQNASGDEKEQVVINICNKIIDEFVSNSLARDEIKTTIKALLPIVIRAIILASKHSYSINLPKKCTKCGIL